LFAFYTARQEREPAKAVKFRQVSFSQVATPLSGIQAMYPALSQLQLAWLWPLSISAKLMRFILEQIYGQGVIPLTPAISLAAQRRIYFRPLKAAPPSRAYYFRGLAELRLCRRARAKADFQRAPNLNRAKAQISIQLQNSSNAFKAVRGRCS